jgi:UMF1 family MFS transporter
LKKKLMLLFCYGGVATACLLFFLTSGGTSFGAVVFVVANLCYGAPSSFTTRSLPEIATEDQRDKVSSRGFAWGYMGGGLLLLLNLALVFLAERIGISTGMAVRLSLLSAGIWWGGFSSLRFNVCEHDRRRARCR